MTENIIIPQSQETDSQTALDDRKVVIEAVGLGKLYRIGGVKAAPMNLRESIMKAVQEPINRFNALRQGIAPTNSDKTFWALKDINFQIKQGDSLGILGINGSGKSTLLKLISHIIEPTEGYIRTVGRIASLLEVGAGFHPELTGRENIYLNATVFGMKKSEIEERFDDIIAFSEIADFMDTPLKRYSSGMRVRLGFSVAIHTEPDILILDEVLAVGDAGFREKCMQKIEQKRQEGITLLIVSHSIGHITRMAEKSLWLERGRIHEYGATGDIAPKYQAEVVDARKK